MKLKSGIAFYTLNAILAGSMVACGGGSKTATPGPQGVDVAPSADAQTAAKPEPAATLSNATTVVAAKTSSQTTAQPSKTSATTAAASEDETLRRLSRIVLDAQQDASKALGRETADLEKFRAVSNSASSANKWSQGLAISGLVIGSAALTLTAVCAAADAAIASSTLSLSQYAPALERALIESGIAVIVIGGIDVAGARNDTQAQRYVDAVKAQGAKLDAILSTPPERLSREKIGEARKIVESFQKFSRSVRNSYSVEAQQILSEIPQDGIFSFGTYDAAYAAAMVEHHVNLQKSYASDYEFASTLLNRLTEMRFAKK